MGEPVEFWAAGPLPRRRVGLFNIVQNHARGEQESRIGGSGGAPVAGLPSPQATQGPHRHGAQTRACAPGGDQFPS